MNLDLSLLDEARIGYRVPAGFLEVMRRVPAPGARSFEPYRGMTLPAFESLYDLLGFELANDSTLPERTPPEVHIFGWMGVDGVHYGHAVLAPELPAEDFPVVEFNYCDDDPAIVWGVNSPDALQNLALSHWECFGGEEADPADAAKAETLRQALREIGLWDERKARAGSVTSSRVPLPTVSGYRHVGTGDGLGVFAPVAAFAPELDHASPTWAAAPIELAESWIERFPASALVWGKEAWWRSGPTPEVRDLMQRAYHALGRPRLAERLPVVRTQAES